MILIMVASVVFFLLDVRFVYTEVHDLNLRVVAFCFILGVVALNRLIARDGKDESIMYIIGLAPGNWPVHTRYDDGLRSRVPWRPSSWPGPAWRSGST